MHQMLQECLTPADQSPEVEAIHHLRTGTRRVEATLETLAREAGARGLPATVEDARQRWLRQLKKVRQAAGAVRDLDVHRELLAANYLPEGEVDAGTTERALAEATSSAHDDLPMLAQARALDHWLAAHRRTAAEYLRHTLTSRTSKIAEVEQQFVLAFVRHRGTAGRRRRPASLLALEDYIRLMDAMHQLDEENLHDFRKGAKKARYVAESEEDPAAAAIAKCIKRVQDSIGDWHDWEVLYDESREALGRDGAALEEDLRRRVEHHYHRALRTAATMNRRLLGEWQALQPARRAGKQVNI